MNYEQTLDFLYSALPMYQRVGPMAFKKDLTNTIRLCEALGNPHHSFKSVHVAGTNGKGSSSHSIAAVLQSAGYKTGLYTSPHLKSFTERIRINGIPVSEQNVIDFIAKNKAAIEEIQPSFFEMTVAMAFDHFAREEVDIAVIEVGLGGRLDSTNVITPLVSLITNIGMDHTEMLGDTLQKIAFEKAGIIKAGIPVVIGTSQLETDGVFEAVAAEREAPICFADRSPHKDYELDLKGQYHHKNIPGVLGTIEALRESGYAISEEYVSSGLANVCKITGLKGRWQQLSDSPITICDTGHNKEAFKEIIGQLQGLHYQRLHLVMGFVNDKNVSEILAMLPSGASMYFCQANVPRAMKLEDLKPLAATYFPDAKYIPDVNEALEHAREQANAEDMIFVGGSTFVVAELNDL